MQNAPIGFQPQSSIRALWLQDIQLDARGNLAGAVVVVDRSRFEDLPALLLFITSTGQSDSLLHETDGEAWIQLTRQQAINLRWRLGELNENTSPFGDDAYDSYSSLHLIDYVVDDEDL